MASWWTASGADITCMLPMPSRKTVKVLTHLWIPSRFHRSSKLFRIFLLHRITLSVCKFFGLKRFLYKYNNNGLKKKKKTFTGIWKEIQWPHTFFKQGSMQVFFLSHLAKCKNYSCEFYYTFVKFAIFLRKKLYLTKAEI